MFVSRPSQHSLKQRLQPDAQVHLQIILQVLVLTQQIVEAKATVAAYHNKSSSARIN